MSVTTSSFGSSAYAQPLMRRLGVVATARASFGVYNDRNDVDVLVDALREARRYFGLSGASS